MTSQKAIKLLPSSHLKGKNERKRISFPEDSNEDYNAPFSLTEVKNALKMSKNTSPGRDLIHYAMLRNLPDISLMFLLSLYNKLWREGTFPAIWKIATIIPSSREKKNDVLLAARKMKPNGCLLYTSPSPRDKRQSRMPSSA